MVQDERSGGVIKDAGEDGDVAVGGAGPEQHAGGFGAGGAGGEYIIDKQDSPAGDILGIADREAVLLVFSTPGE